MNLLIPKNKTGDYIYTYLDYFIQFKRLPVLGTFNHFIINQKLNSKNFKLKEQTTDKYLSKEFLRKIKLNKYIVPTIFYNNSVDKLINTIFQKKHLRILTKENTNSVIIKPTNSQGRKIIKKIKLGVSLKNVLNKEELNKLKQWQGENYYIASRDKCYKDLSPGFIVEPLIDNDNNIRDYKFHIKSSKVKVVQVDSDRFKDHYRNLYNSKFEKLNFSICYKSKNIKIFKPKKFNEIKRVASKIGKYFNYCRVDLYIKKNNSFYIGEITHHHGNGGEPFYDKKNIVVKDIDKEIELSNFFLK